MTLPGDVEERIARCDRVVVIGVGEGGAFVADMRCEPDPFPETPSEEVEAIDELVALLIDRKAALLGCEPGEARWQ